MLILRRLDFFFIKGADTNTTGDDGLTAFMIASKCGHLGVVRCLLSKGADVNVKDRWNFIPLLYASAGEIS